jgi:glycosyltransferase involved in cell wall biosynthesis
MKNNLKYAVVVPCYNEEDRFPFQQFLAFTEAHPEVLICLVNDGSCDKTLSVLKGFQVVAPHNVCVFDMPQNGGKSEAVRQGMLYVLKHYDMNLIGFLDADLATLPEEYVAMAHYKEQHPRIAGIVGSRIPRLGANIVRDDNRSLFSALVKIFIKKMLRTHFQDTQCGAKIFHRQLVPFIFNKPFMTPWLFDVEIFLRIQRKFGKSTLQQGILEYPLMHWTEVGGSKLNWKHGIRIPFQLISLYRKYIIASLFTKKLNFG